MPNIAPQELAATLAETRGLKIKAISYLSGTLIGVNLITPKGDVIRFSARIDEVFEASEGTKIVALKKGKISGNRLTKAKNSPWLDKNEFLKLVEMGMSYREMAIHWQISEGRVSTCAAQHGLEPRRENHDHKELRQRITDARAANSKITQKALAKKLGVSEATISRLSRKEATMIRSDLKIPPGDLVAEAMQSLGLSQDELAQNLGISADELSQLVQGKLELSSELGQGLERALNIPSYIWEGLEQDYRH